MLPARVDDARPAPVVPLTSSIEYCGTSPEAVSLTVPTAPRRHGVRLPCPASNGRLYPHARREQPMPWMCGKLSCPVCVAQVARDIGIAIAFAKPTSAALITKVPADWDAIQRGMNDIRRTLKRAGLTVRDAYHAEPNPSGTGAHLHVWLHGDRFVPQLLREAAARVGFYCEGIVPAVVPDADELPSVHYGMKHAMDADEANEVSLALRDEFLSLNNGRIVHPSHGFWRDGRDGRPISGWRRAARDARAAYYAETEELAA